MAGNVWSVNQMLRMETNILSILEFDINLPPASTFLENYSRAIHVNEPKVLIYASFLIDLFLMKEEFIRFSPSLVVAVSLDLSLKFHSLIAQDDTFSRSQEVLKEIMKSQSFSPEDVSKCTLLIQRYLMCEMAHPCKSLLTKYYHSRA